MEAAAVEELCKMYYDEETFAHAQRVADQARRLSSLFNHCSLFAPDNDFVFQLGLAHDLYEDTSITKGIWFDERFENNLKLLTKPSDVDYNTYVHRIYTTACYNDYYFPAYVVKLADMHDHLAQTETLTERLKDKYVAAMPYLF